MGYGYSNGLIEGMIIGNLMHPTGTTLYNGGGYGGQAVLYPDGRVVNQQGYEVGTYNGGVFNPVQNGQFVAQQAPQQPPVIVQSGWDGWDVFWTIAGILFLVWLCCACFGSDTVTTVETETMYEGHDVNVEGRLRRKRDGEQYYVLDPVDHKKVFVNDTDDMYEDADGDIWRLK